MALHHPATGNTLVLDDTPIVVRLAVLFSLGLPQKHDRMTLDVRIWEQARSSLVWGSPCQALFRPPQDLIQLLTFDSASVQASLFDQQAASLSRPKIPAGAARSREASLTAASHGVDAGAVGSSFRAPFKAVRGELATAGRFARQTCIRPILKIDTMMQPLASVREAPGGWPILQVGLLSTM